jgi:hypothetical protein
MSASRTNYRLTVGALVSTTFGVYTRNLLPFLLLGTFALLPWIGLRVYLDEDIYQVRAEPVDPGAMLAAVFGTLFLQVLLTYVLTGAVTFGVVQQLRGERAGVWVAFSKGVAMLGPSLLTGILSGVRILLFTLLLIVPGIIESMRLYVAIPVTIMEGKSAGAAVQRSITLTRGSLWPLFWTLVLMAAFSFLIAVIGGLVFVAMGGEIGVQPAWFDIVVTVVVNSFAATMGAVAYFLLRKGKEHVGAKEIAAVFD